MNKPLFPDVIVNGQTIASADIAAEAQNHNAPSGKPGLAWRAAVQALTIRTLLLQEADRLDIAAAQQTLEGKQETVDEARIRAVLENQMEIADVSDSDCQALYDKQPGRFHAPDLFEASHILFSAAPDDTQARSGAKFAAAAAIEEITADPKTFARIAKESSACQSRENGGSMGQISSGDTVAEFEAALKQMRAGELYPEPVETRYGFHVVRLDALAKGEPLPFQAVKNRIRERLEQRAWTKAAHEYATHLHSSANIATG